MLDPGNALSVHVILLSSHFECPIPYHQPCHAWLLYLETFMSVSVFFFDCILSALSLSLSVFLSLSLCLSLSLSLSPYFNSTSSIILSYLKGWLHDLESDTMTLLWTFCRLFCGCLRIFSIYGKLKNSWSKARHEPHISSRGPPLQMCNFKAKNV